MKTILILFALFLSNGCNNLERILNGAESHPPEPIVYGNPHVVQGVTVFDYQMIEGIPILDRAVTVEVKRPGETEFSFLNQYEFKMHINVPTPGVSFKNRAFINGGLINFPYPPQPTAPIGTEFIITSYLVP